MKLQATSSITRKNRLLISTTKNKDRKGNKGGEDLFLTKCFRNKGENSKYGRGNIFYKTFYNETNEKHFYQAIAKQLLNSFEL